MIPKWRIDKEDLVRERGFRCEICGKPTSSLTLDHAIFSNARHRKGYTISELNEKYNLIVCCLTCNQEKPKKYWDNYGSYEEWAWVQNCKRYGEDKMVNWFNRVPLKIKPRFVER